MRLASLTVLSLALGAPAFAASPGQADICHWSEGTAQVITVSVKAVSSHLANHGDSAAALYFSDADGDGFGDADGATDRCPNAGFVANNTDCDDGDASVNPGAAEVPYDGIDNDCAEGTREDDLDNDGFLLADDCDDGDATVNPGAEDVCDDSVDNNCDGSIDENCAGDCPCFTTADIDAAYADHLAVGNPYADQNSMYAQCHEYDHTYTDGYGYSYDYDYTQVWFDSFSGDYADDYYNYWAAYEGANSNFYGYSYAQGDYEDTHCYNYSNTYAYDGVNYTNDQVYIYQAVTEAQAEACEEVVRDWAADNGMDCPVYVY